MNKLVRKKIPQFLKYINKVYGFAQVVAAVDDFRRQAEILSAQVFLSVFWMFQLRLPSFNALEPELELEQDMKKLIDTDRDRIASADALGYSLKRFDLIALQEQLFKINKQAKRNKVLAGGTIGGLVVVAVDGTEDSTSENIHCDQCSKRRVKKVKTIHGKKVRTTVNEYYHRAVLCQIVGSKPPLILGAGGTATRGRGNDRGATTGR